LREQRRLVWDQIQRMWFRLKRQPWMVQWDADDPQSIV
jgi:hypothetical protein